MKTEELVYALLDSIDTAKEDLPSVRMIRERLGKGSYGTISAALRNWKKATDLLKRFVMIPQLILMRGRFVSLQNQSVRFSGRLFDPELPVSGRKMKTDCGTIRGTERRK